MFFKFCLFIGSINHEFSKEIYLTLVILSKNIYTLLSACDVHLHKVTVLFLDHIHFFSFKIKQETHPGHK